MTKRYIGKGLYSGFFQQTDPLREAFSIGKYETRSRLDSGNASTSIPSGNVSLTPIWLPSGFPVSSLSFASGVTVAGAGLTHTWFSIYDNNRTLLGMTSDDTSTTWPVSTTKTLSIATIASGASGSFTTTYEGYYYISPTVVGTTPPNYVNGGNLGQPVANTTPYLGVVATSYSAPPAFPLTLATPTQGGPLLYGYVN